MVRCLWHHTEWWREQNQVCFVSRPLCTFCDEEKVCWDAHCQSYQLAGRRKTSWRTECVGSQRRSNAQSTQFLYNPRDGGCARRDWRNDCLPRRRRRTQTADVVHVCGLLSLPYFSANHTILSLTWWEHPWLAVEDFIGLNCQMTLPSIRDGTSYRIVATDPRKQLKEQTGKTKNRSLMRIGTTKTSRPFFMFVLPLQFINNYRRKMMILWR